MNEILRRFMTDRDIRTTPSLVDLVYDVAGAETGGWFHDELAKGP